MSFDFTTTKKQKLTKKQAKKQAKKSFLFQSCQEVEKEIAKFSKHAMSLAIIGSKTTLAKDIEDHLDDLEERKNEIQTEFMKLDVAFSISFDEKNSVLYRESRKKQKKRNCSKEKARELEKRFFVECQNANIENLNSSKTRLKRYHTIS